MTLNNLERRNSLYFAFFSPNSTDFQADYITVVEERPIMSLKYYLPVSVFHFWPKLMHPAARSLCDCWTSCYIVYCKPELAYNLRQRKHDNYRMKKTYLTECKFMNKMLFTDLYQLLYVIPNFSLKQYIINTFCQICQICNVLFHHYSASRIFSIFFSLFYLHCNVLSVVQ